jgi:imidazolonepropionase-like amidohydrolase
MFEHPTRRQEREVEERLVAELSRAGVVILAGSDAGSANQNLYPGFGLHDELTELARVGLQPAQILRAATLHAARWLGRDAEVGSIEKGMLADLVLLDSNPLDDIHNTSKIRMVITNGKLLQRRQLDQMLEAAAVAAK